MNLLYTIDRSFLAPIVVLHLVMLWVSEVGWNMYLCIIGYLGHWR